MVCVEAWSTRGGVVPHYSSKKLGAVAWGWLLPCSYKRSSDRLSEHTLRRSSQTIICELERYPPSWQWNERIILRTFVLGCRRVFIVSRMGSHLCWGGPLTLAAMMMARLVTEQSSSIRWLTGAAHRGDVMVHPPRQSARSMAWGATICLRRQSDVSSSVLLTWWNDCPWEWGRRFTWSASCHFNRT